MIAVWSGLRELYPSEDFLEYAPSGPHAHPFDCALVTESPLFQFLLKKSQTACGTQVVLLPLSLGEGLCAVEGTPEDRVPGLAAFVFCAHVAPRRAGWAGSRRCSR